jgi:DNA-binding beta-propeller fold protein YncE
MRFHPLASTALFLAVLAGAAAPARAQEVVTLTGSIDGGTGGLAVDAAGNIFIGDFGPSLSGGGTRVFRVTPAGSVSVFATGFQGASGNAFDSMGNLYQSNINGARIDRIAPDGTVSLFTSSQIIGPVGIVANANDAMFVCNCAANNIRKVTQGGFSTLFASGPLFQCPNGIARDDDGNFYVSNFNDGTVIRIPQGGGTPELFATVPGSNNGHITYHDGLLYVAARGANRIYTISLDGDVQLFAGTGAQGIVDGPRLSAQFSLPNDIAFDPTGTYLYVNDVVNPDSNADTAPMVLRRIDLTVATGVDAAAAKDGGDAVRVRSVRPNPFRAETRIAFTLPRAADVRLSIHDVAGREVRTLVNGALATGDHEAVWQGRDAADRPVGAGVYFYRLETDAGTRSGRIHLLR